VRRRMNKNDYIRKWLVDNQHPCEDCGNIISYQSITCRPCLMKRRTEIALNRTIGEVKLENKSLRWTDHVRSFARKLHQFDKCEICGYDKHVQVAHIKSVSSFPDSSTIREVNSRDNVRGLCPNHHWEFDNGML